MSLRPAGRIGTKLSGTTTRTRQAERIGAAPLLRPTVKRIHHIEGWLRPREAIGLGRSVGPLETLLHRQAPATLITLSLADQPLVRPQPRRLNRRYPFIGTGFWIAIYPAVTARCTEREATSDS